MRIGALAQSLAVPVPTLRRWTEEFADGLSVEARGDEGRPREFSARDQRVMRRVHDLLADRDMTYAAVRRRLKDDGLLGAVSPPEPSAEAGPASDEERLAAEKFVEIIVARCVEPLRRRIEQLEAELGDVRSAAREAQTSLDPTEGAGMNGRRRWPFR